MEGLISVSNETPTSSSHLPFFQKSFYCPLSSPAFMLPPQEERRSSYLQSFRSNEVMLEGYSLRSTPKMAPSERDMAEYSRTVCTYVPDEDERIRTSDRAIWVLVRMEKFEGGSDH